MDNDDDIETLGENESFEDHAAEVLAEMDDSGDRAGRLAFEERFGGGW